MLNRLRYLVLSSLIVLMITGCSSSSKKFKYRIAVIPKGLTHEHWQSVHRGAERAAEDFAKQGIAVEVLWDGPTKESEATQQIQLVDQKLSMGIHGLVLAPQHSKQMLVAVERAVEDKVPVVVLDSDLDAEAVRKRPELTLKYVATNNYNGGKLAGQHLLQVLEKEGLKEFNLVLLRYAPGSESTEQREQGFLDYLDEQRKKGKKIQLLESETYAGATVESAQKAVSPLLNRLEGKRVDGIFAVNESSTTGLLNALRSQGKTKTIHVMGFDSSRPLEQALREGEVDGLVIQDPYRMGYLGVWMIVQHQEGYDVRADGRELSTGETVMTRENLDSREVREKFDPKFQPDRVLETPKYTKKKE